MIILLAINHPGLDVVLPLLIKHILQLLLHCRVFDRTEHLDPIIDIPRHQICRAKEILGLSSVMENIDPRVLKIAINNTDRLDVL